MTMGCDVGICCITHQVAYLWCVCKCLSHSLQLCGPADLCVGCVDAAGTDGRSC